jgi:hypothetical protein
MGNLGAAMDFGRMQGANDSDAQPTDEMLRELAEVREMLTGAGPVPEAPTQLPDQMGAPQPLAAMQETAPDTLVGDRTGRGRAAPPASASNAMTTSIGRDADRGFAIPENPACPPGTKSTGSAPPDGFKLWCTRVGEDAGVKHGWLTTWYENQQPAMAGEYNDGMRVGVWTRWYRSGGKRVQAEFTDGLQHGALIAWDEGGAKVYEERFSAGLPVLD